MNRVKRLVCALASIVLSTCACLILAGCAQASPSDVVDNALTAIKEADAETLSANYSGTDLNFEGIDALQLASGQSSASDMSEEQQEVTEKLLSLLREFDYEIGEETIDGDKATVEVAITTYDFGEALTNSLTSYFRQAIALAFSDPSEEQLTNLFYDEFRKELSCLEEKTVSTSATFTLTKTDNGWTVDEISDETKDALFGGMISKIKSFSNALDSE